MATKTGHSRALKTYVKLMRAAESITARVHKHLSSVGLTVSQFGVLEAIFHLGPLSQKSLGRKILRSSGNITMVIDNLEKQALVFRTRSDEDRRSYQVDLTEKGEDLIREIFPPHSRRITERMSALTIGEQKILGGLLTHLGGQRDKTYHTE